MSFNEIPIMFYYITQYSVDILQTISLFLTPKLNIKLLQLIDPVDIIYRLQF